MFKSRFYKEEFHKNAYLRSKKPLLAHVKPVLAHVPLKLTGIPTGCRSSFSSTNSFHSFITVKRSIA